MNKSACFWLIFLHLLPGSWGQKQAYQFVRYGQEDGLPSNTVFSMAQDDLGYLWLGTNEGLCRFDGTVFTYFQENPAGSNDFKGKLILSVFKDKNGNIWAGSDNNGLNFIDTRKGLIRNYQHVPEDTTSISSNFARCIFEDYRGRLWAGGRGLNLFDPELDSFTRVMPFTDKATLNKYNGWQLEFLQCLQDPVDEETVWLIAAYGICRFNVETFESKYFFPSEAPIANRAAVMDEDGMIWLTDYGTGLHRFERNKLTFDLFTCGTGGYNPSNCQNAAGLIGFGRDLLLLASTNSGLMFFDKKTGSFSLMADLPMQGGTPPLPLSFFKDRAGNIWVTTWNKGLYCLQPHRQFFKKTNLTGNVRQVVRHPVNNQILTCTREGRFYVLDSDAQPQAILLQPSPAKPEETGLTDLAFDKNNRLWILGGQDLYTWEPGSSSIAQLDWPDWRKKRLRFGYYWDFTFDGQGNLWISAQTGGLGRLDFADQTLTIYRFEPGNPHSLAHDFSIGRVFTDSRGDVWGGPQNGLFHFTLETGYFQNSPNPPKASDRGKVFTGSRGFAEDQDGHIWIAAGLNRVGRVRRGNSIDQPVEIVPLSLTLPAAAVWGMVTDRNGNIWIGSDAGLTVINPGNYHTRHFDETYGVPSIHNLSAAPDGEIFAAAMNGFYRFHPDSIGQKPPAPRPLLTSFKVFDKLYGGGLDPNYLEEVVLSYKQNFFSFEFSAIDFSSKSKKEFACMLEGLENDWVITGERRYAAYTNVGGGAYTFRVKVRNEFGEWSEEEAKLRIRIIPPVWQQAWFWALVLAALASGIYVVYKYRVGQIRRDEAIKTAFHKQLAEVEMKALRAQMNPHFLFNSLNAIKFYVLKRSKGKAAEYLTDFAKLIRLVLHNSSQQLISLAQELEALDLYIRIERLRFDELFEYEIRLTPEVDADDFMIPPLLLQPYVENAIWHGLMHKKDGAGLLTISIDRQKEGLRCIIEDNGIGREKAAEVKSKSAQKTKSMGMSITRDRMDFSKILTDMDFEVSIEDLKNTDGTAAGTRVIIFILPNN